MISARGRSPSQAHSAAKSVHYLTEGLRIDPSAREGFAVDLSSGVGEKGQPGWPQPGCLVQCTSRLVIVCAPTQPRYETSVPKGIRLVVARR
jgi:hypothetical protein